MLAGILAIVAAVIAAWPIWISIRENERKISNNIKLKRRYVAVVLSSHFSWLNLRATHTQGTIKAQKGANIAITESTRRKTILELDPIIKDCELMSLLPTELLSKIVSFIKMIDEHNFDMERAGGAFGDDNFGESILRRLDAIQFRCKKLEEELDKQSQF